MEAKILELFRKEKSEFLSGEDLSRTLNISRAAVWKHIEKLRQAGYQIAAQPHLGYKLESSPDILSDWELLARLNTKIIGGKIISYQTCPSTMDVASKLAEDRAPEGTIVTADSQTEGRGRLGRKWQSPPEGGIYLSIILRPDIPLGEIPLITLLAAVAIVRAIRKSTHLEAMIKWPNDILINNKKIAGILTELKAETDKIKFVIVGLGVNVKTSLKDLPEAAGSLEGLTDKKITRVEIAGSIISEFDGLYQQFVNREFKTILTEAKNYSITLGSRVKVKTIEEEFEGQAVDIDETGALVIRLDSGFNKAVLAGDVTKVD